MIDVYDALTSERPYKAPWTHENAMLELNRQAGETLDRNLIEAFERSPGQSMMQMQVSGKS